ncbi:hypothetical protein BH10BAC3_BH10BAC3_20070 [soil metagenome]
MQARKNLKKLNEVYTKCNSPILLKPLSIEKISCIQINFAYPEPDVTLLDLNMPKMNGIEFLKALRNDEILKNIKVFVLATTKGTI